MNDSKEFLGKTLDAAIAEACAYYDVPREKLEIDIIEDAKTGIFGIVGARKAKIHARLATLPDFMQLGFSAPKPEREGRRNRKERRREKLEEAAPASPELELPAEASEAVNENSVVEKAEALTAEAPAAIAEPAPAAVEPTLPDAEKADAADEAEASRGRRGRKERQPRQPRRESAAR